MHCSIVELDEKPIHKLSRLRDTDVCDDEEFMSAVADYVAELECPYKEAVKAFVKELGNAVEYDKETNSITFVNLNSFFRDDYQRFQELVKDLTIEDFRNSSWKYKVQSTLAPRFGTYIYWDYPQQINDFIRDNVKEGDKLYIGGILDYHC